MLKLKLQGLHLSFPCLFKIKNEKGSIFFINFDNCSFNFLNYNLKFYFLILIKFNTRILSNTSYTRGSIYFYDVMYRC